MRYLVLVLLIGCGANDGDRPERIRRLSLNTPADLSEDAPCRHRCTTKMLDGVLLFCYDGWRRMDEYITETETMYCRY